MQIYIAKADQYVNVDVDTLPAATLEYVVKYGLTQSLSDAAASIKGDSTDAAANTMALVNKRLAKLLNGEPPAIGQRTSDPIKADAIDLAIDMTVKGQFKKANKPLDAKAMRAAAMVLIAKNPAYMHLAQKRADAKDELAKQMADFEDEPAEPLAGDEVL